MEKYLKDPTLFFGVYGIRNTKNNKVYVGGTKKSFKKRWRDWRYSLKTNRAAYNPKLQNAWNKYAEFFVFEILEVVEDVNLVHVREQWWIDNTKETYNISNTAIIARYKKPNRNKLIAAEEHSKIVNLYIDGLSLKEIAKIYNCSTMPISQALKANNIKFRRQRKVRTPEMIEQSRQANLGKASPKKGRRQERLCICGNSVGEYYNKQGRFAGYNKTCGDLKCISYFKAEGIKKRTRNKYGYRSF